MNKNYIIQVHNNEFNLDIKQFYLLNPEDKRKTLAKGHGWIKQTNDQFFKFNIFIRNYKNIVPDILDFTPTILDNIDEYSFKCIDWIGKKWRFDTRNIKLNQIELEKGRAVTIEGKVNIIENEILNQNDNNYIEFVFTNEFNFPYNKYEQNKHTIDEKLITLKHIKAIDYKYDDTHIKGNMKNGLVFIRFIKDKFNTKWQYRLLEALKLVTGQQLRPCAIIIQNRHRLNTIYFSQFHKDNFNLRPPIRLSIPNPVFYNNSWLLFEKFINKTKSYKGKYFSPLGSEINGLIGDGTAFFNADVLNLCVRVEGLLKILFAQMGKPSKNTINFINGLIKYIKKYKTDYKEHDRLMSRILNSIGQIKAARAKDKLLALKTIGVIDQHQFKAWNEIRHMSVHADKQKSRGDINNIYDKYLLVLDMYYRILFYGIGYKGLYTAYSTTGMEVKFRLENI